MLLTHSSWANLINNDWLGWDRCEGYSLALPHDLETGKMVVKGLENKCEGDFYYMYDEDSDECIYYFQKLEDYELFSEEHDISTFDILSAGIGLVVLLGMFIGALVCLITLGLR
jgi:hypothetical protein